MVEIEIDGVKVDVKEGSMIMDAANKIGTYIPHFCYHKKLSIAASCRMCLVEVEKAPKPLPACATPVSAGMIVRSNSDKAVQAQKGVMEFLLINHPLDCPICDQGGECQLQDLAVGYGKSASRYTEEKRVVVPKDGGPLISMKEMSRCIHCTRCVRFGQEIAGVMELGMIGRGEHAEIVQFVGKTVDSELSGNMIDLCPVGALTSKPFRYSARTWELSRRKSISPHDGLGSNLLVQVKGAHVMRVLPLENEAINECWLSDRDRFSYEGLNSDERLTSPMIKQDGRWRQTDWQTALEYVAHGLRNIRHEHGADAIATLATPTSTSEELFLLQKLMRGLGTENIDFRLRQSDFGLPKNVIPWLGMTIAEFAEQKNVLVIGSFLRKDQPLLTAKLRQSVKQGGQVSIIHATDDDQLMPISNKIIRPPSQWLAVLNEIISAVATTKNIKTPEGFGKAEPSVEVKQLAERLIATPAAIFIGNAAASHPQASAIHVAAEWIAANVNAKFGYLTDGANTVGGHLVGAIPANDNNSAKFFTEPKKAYVLFNVEPELDCANPVAARSALDKAEMVVVMSPFQHGHDFADVLLPISPFTETGGTFVNCEGRAQSFNGTVKPLGETRPGWKVLRVLGNLLGLEKFDYDNVESIRNELLGAHTGETDGVKRLNNFSGQLPSVSTSSLEPLPIPSPIPSSTSSASAQPMLPLERIADVPIYASDAIVRRALALQKTHDGQAPRVHVSPELATKLNITAGGLAKVSQDSGAATLVVEVDTKLPANVVRVAAAHSSTAMLSSMFGPVSVERA